METSTAGPRYGHGLNSIRWRFALASAVLAAAGLAAFAIAAGLATMPTALAWAAGAAVVAVISAATWVMASRLTASIEALRVSTERLAAGTLDQFVDVDCACEVGGLADSFRKMSSRLNDNIQRIRSLAYVDGITGLPNRRALEQTLQRALSLEQGGRFRAGVFFIDLDGFKRVNDTLGHAGGDELLRAAARRMVEQGFRLALHAVDDDADAFGDPGHRLPEDLVFARYAGDEFVAVLPGVTDRHALLAIGERVVAALDAPFRIRGNDVAVGASVGIAVAPEDSADAAELLIFADSAMFDAKRAGRRCCRFFSPHIRAGLIERHQTEHELRLAVARDEFELHYQPKVTSSDGTPCGVEALVRWRHPVRGLLPPAAFIPVAEQAGLMGSLGDHVLLLAIRQCRAWLDLGLERPMAVNVSPTQFSDPEFAQRLLSRLFEHRVPPSLLTLEITESLAIQDAASSARHLARLRADGVRIAIDDFGVGFSNLSQLTRLPVDEVKIDRSLIVEIGRSQKSEAVIRAAIGMARDLGFDTVAEGIETPAQRDFIARLGCKMMQGWLYGRPTPASAYPASEAPARPLALVSSA